MSKPRYKWWGYIKGIIEEYPELKKEYNELHRQSMEVQMSGMPTGSGASRSIENIAARELPAPKQARLDAVEKAIAATRRMANGKERLKLIELRFWSKNQKLKLEGCAMRMNISYDTAIDYHGDFIMLVAYFKREITFEELKPRQQFALKKQKSVI